MKIRSSLSPALRASFVCMSRQKAHLLICEARIFTSSPITGSSPCAAVLPNASMSRYTSGACLRKFVRLVMSPTLRPAAPAGWTIRRTDSWANRAGRPRREPARPAVASWLVAHPDRSGTVRRPATGRTSAAGCRVRGFEQRMRKGRGSAEEGSDVGLLDAIRGEFIDIVEWTDDSRDTIVWRFPRHDNEIKMGAKLVVRESQTAVFVNEGQIADVFTPGTYTLQTQNMPILSTLKGWKYGFDSPFKAEVYFVTTRQFTDMKWGTANPVIVRDAEFGMVRLRAFGSFAAKVVDAAALLRELAGTDPQFRTEEVQEYLRQMIVGGCPTRWPPRACRCSTWPRSRTRSAPGWRGCSPRS